jgi:hypothetical protein
MDFDRGITSLPGIFVSKKILIGLISILAI